MNEEEKKESEKAMEEIRRLSLAQQIAAKAWGGEKTRHLDMIPDLAIEFAKILVEYMYAPHLGCATTEELLIEIKTRIEVDGKLGYRTIDSD